MSANSFGRAIPTFRVESLQAAVRYYVDALGFKILWETPYLVSVAREGCNIFLCERDQGHAGAWTWVGINDADALAAEFRESGAKIRNPPTNYQWAYEMQVEDLDGNVIRLGSDPKEGEPFGPFLDMHGRFWPT